jgi:radical SAM superfamily enzyme YgiQ (UPF0313 family)
MLKVVCLSVNSEDNLSGVPKWEYSLAFAFLQAYFTKSEYNSQTKFVNLIYYESMEDAWIVDDIVDQNADVLAISCYIWNISKVLRIMPQVKERFPNMKIILGGPEFRSDSVELFQQAPAIDVIALGEGEIVFTEILDAIHEKRFDKVHEIIGIFCMNDNGEVVFTGPRPILRKLDEIPSPFLLGLIPLEKLRKTGMVAIETQRGCMSNCAFCYYPKGNKQIRFFNIDRVLEEIKLILSYKPQHLYLMDPTFNSAKGRAKPILRTIIENNENTTISAEMLPDVLDEEVILLSQEANMKTVEIGIQSLNPIAVTEMDRYRKEDKLFENIDLALKHNLYLIPQIIFGLPKDDLKSFFKTFNRTYDIRSNELDILPLLMIPATRYRENADKYGIIYNPEAPYNIIESQDFSREEIAFLYKFTRVVLATQIMKLTINKINDSVRSDYSEIFSEFVKAHESDDWMDYNWPIHSEKDKDNAIMAIDKFYEYYKKQLNGFNDEKLLKELKGRKRSAQFMLAGRFISLPKDKKVMSQSTTSHSVKT